MEREQELEEEEEAGPGRGGVPSVMTSISMPATGWAQEVPKGGGGQGGRTRMRGHAWGKARTRAARGL